DELGGQEVALADGADVVHRDDVGMAEAGQRLGLAQEPAAVEQRRAVFAQAQHLDGDVALELGIARRVDLAHPALAEELDDRVAAELVAGREGRSLLGAAGRAVVGGHYGSGSPRSAASSAGMAATR